MNQGGGTDERADDDSDDDSSFPTELIYCHGHGRIHAKGLCAVTNALKLPADESLPECYRRADR